MLGARKGSWFLPGSDRKGYSPATLPRSLSPVGGNADINQINNFQQLHISAKIGLKVFLSLSQLCQSINKDLPAAPFLYTVSVTMLATKQIQQVQAQRPLAGGFPVCDPLSPAALLLLPSLTHVCVCTSARTILQLAAWPPCAPSAVS